mgnify:FL=1
MNRQAARAGRARRADHDRTAPMSEIVFADGDVCVDAAIIAAGLGIEPARVQPLLRAGRITSTFERGMDEDAGRVRLTFVHERRRFCLVVDEAGHVIEQTAAQTVVRRPSRRPRAARDTKPR